MNPGAALQGFGKVSDAVERAVERAGERTALLRFGLNLQQRARRAQLRAQPAEFVLEELRVPEISGRKSLTAAAAGHGPKISHGACSDSDGHGAMKGAEQWQDRAFERPELCGKHDRMMASLASAIPEMIDRIAVLLRELRAKVTISLT